MTSSYTTSGDLTKLGLDANFYMYQQGTYLDWVGGSSAGRSSKALCDDSRIPMWELRFPLGTRATGQTRSEGLPHNALPHTGIPDAGKLSDPASPTARRFDNYPRSRLMHELRQDGDFKGW